MRSMFRAKIHRVTVTEANVNYEGSITVDRSLMEAADILPFEEVRCWNVTTGARFNTYVLEAEAGSGVVCVNGAAAHLADPGDLLIIATFESMDDASARMHRPTVVLVNERNQILKNRESRIEA